MNEKIKNIILIIIGIPCSIYGMLALGGWLLLLSSDNSIYIEYPAFALGQLIIPVIAIIIAVYSLSKGISYFTENRVKDKSDKKNITEKQKRIIGIILLIISIITMIGWMFGYNIPIPGAIFWIIFILGIIFLIPIKKKQKNEIKNE